MEGDLMRVFRDTNQNYYPVSYYNPLSDIPNGSSPCEQPIVTDDPNYLQGHLNSIINSYIKVSYLLGTNLFLDKQGILKEVGIDYIVLEEPQTGNQLVSDLYSIKFVEVF